MYLSELCIFPTQQYPLDLRTESNAMKSYHKSSEKSLAILTGSTKIGFSTGICIMITNLFLGLKVK